MNETIKCEICGNECADEEELSIFHRGCRLRAAFPRAVKESGSGILILDVKKMREQTNEK